MILVETPFAGDILRNVRFAAWCCRAVYEVEDETPIASHLMAPWYLNDNSPGERKAGIEMFRWAEIREQLFFCDLGWSKGMIAAYEEADATRRLNLAEYHPKSWEGFKNWTWPPGTIAQRIGVMAMKTDQLFLFDRPKE